MTLKSEIKYYRLDRKEIYFLKFILEAYDGIATFKTLDPEAGVVKLFIAPGCEETVEAVMQDLKKEIMIEVISDHNTPGLLTGLSASGTRHFSPKT
ncbi:MAG: DUF4911 domain-containing protein [Deltaproteobacteria bacterium]|nr:DUF4911 domain-containing protein [Deltaproteobacteria bacterium]